MLLNLNILLKKLILLLMEASISIAKMERVTLVLRAYGLIAKSQKRFQSVLQATQRSAVPSTMRWIQKNVRHSSLPALQVA